MPGSLEEQYIRLEVWGNTVTLPSHTSLALSVEIRASYEAGRMLGSGKVIRKLQMSWDELLDHGDEPFDVSFPPVRNVCPSLTLRAAAVHACDDQDNMLSDHFQSVLDQCPVGHPDHAAALTNLTYARLGGYIQNHLQDIDTTTSLFHESLALHPQGHPDHVSSLYNLITALNWCYSKESTVVYIHESVQLCCKLLPLCPEDTYLYSISVDDAVDYVISNLPIDTSDEGIHLRQNILKLCPLRGSEISSNFRLVLVKGKHAYISHKCKECKGNPKKTKLSHRGGFLNNLALSLVIRFDNQGKPNDLDEAITLHKESLHLHPVGHEYRNFTLDNLGAALVAHFKKRGDIDDITRAISLRREALMLCPPGHPHRDTILNNLAYTLKTRYDESYVSEDLNEAIDRYHESHLSTQLDHPEHHVTLYNLSVVLCSHFKHTQKNGDIEEAIQLCQEALASLPSLHPDRSVVYAWLQRAYLSRYCIQHNPTDLSSAMEHFRLSSTHSAEGFPQCIMVAIDWAHQAEIYQHESALEAYQMCFELFDSHVMSQSSIFSWHEAATAFHGAQSLPVDATSCVTRHDNLRQAVELLEQGRGQQWSLASRLRTPLEDLWSARYAIFEHSRVSCSHLPMKTYRFARAIQHASVMGPKVPHNDLIVLLRTVWNEIMLPIVNVLENILKLNHCSRIWLCPTAAFTSIPLHVAHPFQTNADGSKEQKRVTPSFVTIGQGQPGAGKGKALLAVDSELELVHKLVPATAKRALQALEENTWVHLACHGKQDPTQPYNSHFVMRDEHLTLLDIMEKDIPHAEFAFLSACHTAVGDEKTPDEVIHLAAGLQFSGFKSVIGTLWEVNNAVAKHVVKAFYKYMFMDLKDVQAQPTRLAPSSHTILQARDLN
ncbi:CHAT domain-containing protein [Suillus cothurnatus]|nr:CHAT domain-containing protein [Suillus cothurnatus]